MSGTQTVLLVLLPPLAYLLGSIPFGLLVTRTPSRPGGDLRKAGSGNIGATNVLRIAGLRPGLLTLLGDFAKGALPVGAALLAVDSGGQWRYLYPALVGLCAVLGHLFPVWLGFRDGGKGVATAAGCFAVLSPLALLVAVLIFVLLVCVTDRVSVGSLAGTAALAPTVWKTTGSLAATATALLVAVLIFFRHRENIRRLLRGGEARLSDGVQRRRP